MTCVYMPHKDKADKITDDSVEQLVRIEQLIDNYSDCHIVVCGDLNVDFARAWLHTVLMRSFCDNLSI